MKPPRSLTQILGKLEAVKRTSEFDDLLRIVHQVARLKAQGRINTVAERIRPRLWDETRVAGRMVFKRSDEFEASHGDYPRIDRVVRDLMITPPEDAVMPGVVTMLPSPDKAREMARQITDEPFRCSSDVCVRLRSMPPDFLVAGRNMKSKGWSYEDIATDLALHILASWWAVRFDCVVLAIAETIVAIDDGVIHAFAVAPDGTRTKVPGSLLMTTDGWGLISEGFAMTERSHSLVPGVSGPAEAGIYVFNKDPVGLVRRGTSKQKLRDQAVRWLVDQVNAAPQQPRTRGDIQDVLEAPPWEIEGFKTIWTEAMKRAEPGHLWNVGGRRKNLTDII